MTFGKVKSYYKSRPLLFRLVRGAIWVVLGTAATRLFSLITNIVIARILGTEDFGAYGFLMTTFETLAVFSGMAFGFSLIKYTAEYRDRDPVKAGRYIAAAKAGTYISASIMSLIIALGSEKIVIWIFNRPDLQNLLQLGAVYLFLRTINNIQIGSLTGLEAFREIARVYTISGFLDPLLTIPLVCYYGLKGSVIALIIIAIVSFIYSYSIFKKKCIEKKILVKIFDRSVIQTLPSLLSFSVPAFISSLMLMPITWITNSILISRSEGYSELGLFNAANQWRQFIVLVPAMTSTVMLAIAANSYKEKDKNDYRQSFMMNLKLTWIYALPSVVIVILFAGTLNSLFGVKYESARNLIPPLIVTAFLSVLNTVSSTAVTGAGRMWIEVWINLTWATTIIALSILLVPAYGAVGLAYSTLFGGLCQIFVRLIYISNALIPGSIRKFFPLIVLSVTVLSMLLGLTETGRFNVIWGIVLTAAGAMPLLKAVISVLK